MIGFYIFIGIAGFAAALYRIGIKDDKPGFKIAGVVLFVGYVIFLFIYGTYK